MDVQNRLEPAPVPRAQVLFERHDETEAGLVAPAKDAAIRHLEAELVAQAIQASPDVQRRESIM
ncbi:hypothetical protein AB0B45_36975 [Nonomuraea sp. NPDC049152]|uniref:hypothetical protein n=1 Tax=Nonomuraea sp. NPDC049152 TaxID=3154350 RepID=UPI0033D6E2E4